MGGLLLKIQDWWRAADRTQRMVVLGGGLILTVMLVGTGYFASRPKFAVLYAGLSEQDKGQIVAELEGMGVPAEYEGKGTIRVPADQVPTLRVKMMNAGKVPKSAHPGIEGLEKMNLLTTPAVERERLKVMLEGELAQTIEMNPGVESARVHITLGDDSPFQNEDKPSTAAVTISEAPGARLTAEQARSIAIQVAKGGPGLDVKDVVVLNQDAKLLFDGRAEDSTQSQANSKLAMEQKLAQTRQMELQGVLDRALGVGATIVLVRCELDLDESTTETISRSPSKGPISERTVTETMDDAATAAAASGLAGVSANLAPGGGDGAGDKKGKYKSEWSDSEKLVNEEVARGRKATGKILSMNINVIANSDRVKDESLEALKVIVAAEMKNKKIGADGQPLTTEEAQRFQTEVTAVKFDETATKQAAEASTAAASSQRMQQIFSLLPIGALLVVGFMVVKQLGKIGAAKETVLLATPDGTLVPVGPEGITVTNGTMRLVQDSFSGGGASALAAPKPKKVKTNPDDEDEDDEDDDVRVGKIKDKIHVPLEQIKKMAVEKPEVVAMLIKSWVLDEKR